MSQPQNMTSPQRSPLHPRSATNEDIKALLVSYRQALEDDDFVLAGQYGEQLEALRERLNKSDRKDGTDYELEVETTKLYRVAFEKSYNLWQKNDYADNLKVVDMMLKMRKYSNLSLFYRAWVTNLLASAADMEKYDVKRYFDEALRMAAEMRRRAPNRNWGPNPLHYISAIEDFANERLREVKKSEAKLRAEGKHVFPSFIPIVEDAWVSKTPALKKDMLTQIEGTAYMTYLPDQSDSQGIEAIAKGVDAFTMSPSASESHEGAQENVDVEGVAKGSFGAEKQEAQYGLISPPDQSSRSLHDFLAGNESSDFLTMVTTLNNLVLQELSKAHPEYVDDITKSQGEIARSLAMLSVKMNDPDSTVDTEDSNLATPASVSPDTQLPVNSRVPTDNEKSLEQDIVRSVEEADCTQRIPLLQSTTRHVLNLTGKECPEAATLISAYDPVMTMMFDEIQKTVLSPVNDSQL